MGVVFVFCFFLISNTTMSVLLGWECVREEKRKIEQAGIRVSERGKLKFSMNNYAHRYTLV